MVPPDSGNPFEPPYLACPTCGASHDAPDRVIEDALHANWMGGLLDILTNQGVKLLNTALDDKNK